MDPSSTTSMMQHSVITWVSSNLHTQNWAVDVMLVMAVSGLISAAIAWYHSGREAAASGVNSALSRLLRYFGLVSEPFTLTVEYNTVVNKYGDESPIDCSSDNQHLLEAVFAYAESCDGLENANLNVTQASHDYANQYERFKKKAITLKPIDSRIIIDHDISVTVSVQIEQGNEKVGTSTRSSAVIESRTSFRNCQEFARKAYDYYVDREFGKYDEDEDKKLKYYSIRSIDHETGSMTWNQFQLGTQRGFDYLYFDEKEASLKLIDNFVNRSAQFAVNGPTYKLGFLLYGVPGCGKTSFIKALANYTKRHIVDMHLSKFAKNSELRDAFFQTKLTYYTKGSTETALVPLDKRIIIMEDIDALSDLVARRSDTDTWEEKDFKKMKPGQEKTDEQQQQEEQKEPEKEKSAIEKYIEKHERLEDRLNLAALLSVMDGTLELTGPILIMTTNLPEKLDPALIRSGRITKHIYFGKMSLKSIIEMLRFYFKDEVFAAGMADGGERAGTGVGEPDAATDCTISHTDGDLLRSSGATIDFSLPIDFGKDTVQTTSAFRDKHAPLYEMMPHFEELHRKIAPNDLEAICRNSLDLADCCLALSEFLANLA
eukprot:TRINITY_DN291_c0_g1_i1.p1 TRINITY_DN291_c0_g1~~TRINITY_DN291_c0_g1_i1.p1  ORF type:complete len:601 (+),score=280.02 TRINITY_DN291_c0_g1_i1:130-1932(+)